MKKKTAVIVGVNGQLGSILSEFLIQKDYSVIGTIRRSSNPDHSNLSNLKNDSSFTLDHIDLTDSGSINRVVSQVKPDEFYNIGAMSFVKDSWDQPISTFDINTTGVVRELESIRLFSPQTKFYQTSTSECIGASYEEKQSEKTPLLPQSPYAASKVASEAIVRVYQKSYNLFCCFSRNFNFESKRRGKQFVTRKITDAVAEMLVTCNSVDMSLCQGLEAGVIKPLVLGNIEACRDWSHASDIANGIWLMMQKEYPETYIFGSGKTRSIREFLTETFSLAGIDDWSNFVTTDAKFTRPAEVNYLCADASKAERELGWIPKVSFEDMVKEMLYNDVQLWTQKLGVISSAKELIDA